MIRWTSPIRLAHFFGIPGTPSLPRLGKLKKKKIQELIYRYAGDLRSLAEKAGEDCVDACRITYCTMAPIAWHLSLQVLIHCGPDVLDE